MPKKRNEGIHNESMSTPVAQTQSTQPTQPKKDFTANSWTQLNGKTIEGMYNEKHDLFSAQISRKKGKNSSEYDRLYLNVVFSAKAQNKFEALPMNEKNIVKFTIVDGWLSCYHSEKTGVTYPQIFVNDLM